MAAIPDNAPLIVIVGETASGKSALALKLAQELDGEIICADSRTVYTGMDVGTAKPSAADRAKVAHHLLDIITPDQNFTAADFKHYAQKAIQDIHNRDKLPIMTGGTGLYIDSVLFDYQFSERARDEQNPRHAEQGGQSDRSNSMRANTLVIGLSKDREGLDERITKRTMTMLEQGLVAEVKQLVDRYGWEAPGLQTIGYQELKPYLAGEQDLLTTEEQINQNTRAYAKRQRTWFKRNNSIHWIVGYQEVHDLATQFVKNTIHSPN